MGSRKHLLFIMGVQSSRLGAEKKSLYRSVICCLYHAQVLPALAKPQPGSHGEQNHFLRWMGEAGRAQQASLPHWQAQHWLSVRFSPALPAQPPFAHCKQMQEGMSRLGCSPADPGAIGVQPPGHSLTVPQPSPREPLRKESGAAHRGCRRVLG